MIQLYLKKAKAILQLLLLLPLFTFAQIDLVQTTNNAVDISTNVLNCNNGGATFENSYARLYNLTSLGYSSFEVTKVSFAVQQFVLGSAASYAVNVQVYGSTGGAVTSNLTYLGGAPVNLTTSMIGTVVEVPLPTPVTVSSPEMLIVVSAPSGQATQTSFYIGGNSNGQTIPAYIKASACSVNDFTTFSDVGGQNMHIVLFPTGNPTLISPQCPPGNVTLETQAQVNQFIVDYPNCTTINGYLGIGGSASDITNVNALSNLTHITGSLDITQNPLLTNITGLSNVTSIGGDLQIKQNATLQSISSLSNINSVAQGLMIQFNNQLQSLNGLQNITTLDGVLWIIGNPQLQTLSGLHNIIAVGGDIDITNNEVLNDITALQNIDPASITEVDGYGLTIINNPQLSVCNLPNFCTYLANPANTHPRAIWDNLANCVNEAAVVAACTVVQCPQGNVVLSTQAQVDQFIVDNPNCTVINGNLEISGAGITNLNALSNITSVTGSVIITSCAALTDVTGINNIATIGGNFKINFCNSLTTLGNTSNLTTVGGYVDIYYNQNLTSISALQNLTTIGGYLWIEANNSLTTLDGLQNLAEVNGDVSIAWNAMLNDISALQNLNPATITDNQGFGLTIFDNPMLAVCNLPNFCTYISNPDETHPRNISGNLASCINEAAVVAACEAMGTEDFGYAKIMAYPNPVVNVLTLSSSIELHNVSIINMLGQVVLDLKTNARQVDVDMSILPAGNYLVKVATQSSIQTIKLVKK